VKGQALGSLAAFLGFSFSVSFTLKRLPLLPYVLFISVAMAGMNITNDEDAVLYRRPEDLSQFLLSAFHTSLFGHFVRSAPLPNPAIHPVDRLVLEDG